MLPQVAIADIVKSAKDQEDVESRHTRGEQVNTSPINDSDRARIAVALRDAGYDVLISDSVSEALSLIFVNRRIEAVLINDYAQPKMGGQLAAKVCGIHPSIPILVVEADPDSQTSRVIHEKFTSLAILKLEQIWRVLGGAGHSEFEISEAELGTVANCAAA